MTSKSLILRYHRQVLQRLGVCFLVLWVATWLAGVGVLAYVMHVLEAQVLPLVWIAAIGWLGGIGLTVLCVRGWLANNQRRRRVMLARRNLMTHFPGQARDLDVWYTEDLHGANDEAVRLVVEARLERKLPPKASASLEHFPVWHPLGVLAVGTALAVCLVVSALTPPALFQRAAQLMVLQPDSAALAVVSYEPPSGWVEAGEVVAFRAQLNHSPEALTSLELVVAGQAPTLIESRLSSSSTLEASFRAPDEAFEIVLRSGSGQTEGIPYHVYPDPAATWRDVVVREAKTGQRHLHDPVGGIEVPTNSQVELRGRLAACPLRAFGVSSEHQGDLAIEMNDQQQTFAAHVVLTQDDVFTPYWQVAQGAVHQGKPLQVRCLPDVPPTVELLRPSHGDSHDDSQPVLVEAIAHDDHQIGRAYLLFTDFQGLSKVQELPFQRQEDGRFTSRKALPIADLEGRKGRVLGFCVAMVDDAVPPHVGYSQKSVLLLPPVPGQDEDSIAVNEFWRDIVRDTTAEDLEAVGETMPNELLAKLAGEDENEAVESDPTDALAQVDPQQATAPPGAEDATTTEPEDMPSAPGSESLPEETNEGQQEDGAQDVADVDDERDQEAGGEPGQDAVEEGESLSIAETAGEPADKDDGEVNAGREAEGTEAGEVGDAQVSTNEEAEGTEGDAQANAGEEGSEAGGAEPGDEGDSQANAGEEGSEAGGAEPGDEGDAQANAGEEGSEAGGAELGDEGDAQANAGEEGSEAGGTEPGDEGDAQANAGEEGSEAGGTEPGDEGDAQADAGEEGSEAGGTEPGDEGDAQADAGEEGSEAGGTEPGDEDGAQANAGEAGEGSEAGGAEAAAGGEPGDTPGGSSPPGATGEAQAAGNQQGGEVEGASQAASGEAGETSGSSTSSGQAASSSTTSEAEASEASAAGSGSGTQQGGSAESTGDTAVASAVDMDTGTGSDITPQAIDANETNEGDGSLQGVVLGRKEKAVTADALELEANDPSVAHQREGALEDIAVAEQALPASEGGPSAPTKRSVQIVPLEPSAREQAIQRWQQAMERLTNEERQAVNDYYRYLRDIR